MSDMSAMVVVQFVVRFYATRSGWTISGPNVVQSSQAESSLSDYYLYHNYLQN